MIRLSVRGSNDSLAMARRIGAAEPRAGRGGSPVVRAIEGDGGAASVGMAGGTSS